MSRHERSLSGAYFDDLYARDPDPWQFATSAYEHEKYQATLDALPAQRYASALEIGCSIGVLTERLAQRCDTLLALDASRAALAQAERRCAGCANVRFEHRHVPADWPDGRFDLVLLSEVVYYLDRDDNRRLAERIEAAALPGTIILLVHWLGDTHYPLSGDDASEAFLAAIAAERIRSDRTDAYRLDCLRTARAELTRRDER